MSVKESLPEWLLTKENYIPRKDRDAFIDKTILSLLALLARIRTQASYKSDKFFISPLLKLAFSIMLILLISLARNYTFVIIANVYLLLGLSLLNGKEIISILRICLVVALFTFIILLPTLFYGSAYSCIMITSKVFATVMTVNILSHITRWNSITNALKMFLIPDIFILVLDITIKYIVMLGDFTLNMLYALKLRSVGTNRTKNSLLGGIAGTVFIKSKEMAEDMYAAMECRGFTGEYHITQKYRLNWADILSIAINICIVFIFFYLERN